MAKNAPILKELPSREAEVTEALDRLKDDIDDKLKRLPELYGRYTSYFYPERFFELYHNETSGELDNIESTVIFRVGTVGKFGKEDVTETVVSRLEAITKGLFYIEQGYETKAKGTTRSEIDEVLNNEVVDSVIKDGILGKYTLGQSFVLLTKYDDDCYSCQRGYNDSVTSGKFDLSESDIRDIHELILLEGFVPEGEIEESTTTNVLNVFGIEDADNTEQSADGFNYALFD